MVLRDNWYWACSEISYSCVSFSCLMDIHLKLCHVLFLLPIIKAASEKNWSAVGWKKIEVSLWVSQIFPWKAADCWVDIIKFSTIILWCLGGDYPPLRGTHRLTSKFCLPPIGIYELGGNNILRLGLDCYYLAGRIFQRDLSRMLHLFYKNAELEQNQRYWLSWL